MARRAARALSAVAAALAAAAGPALAGAAAPAAAAASSAAAGRAPAITLSALNPQWASPGSTLTVSGTVTNTAKAPAKLQVKLFYSPTPVTSLSALRASAAGSPEGQASRPLPDPAWISRTLAPGASARWSFRVQAAALEATRYGDYKLDAQVSQTTGAVLANALTYVPYVPSTKGRYAATVPSAARVAVIWPLLDLPQLDGPWQDACTGPQAAALAASLAGGGTLNELVNAASAGEAGGSDALTWAVDPALLANAAALSRCGSREPAWSKDASTWLDRVRAVTAKQPLFTTPYGDPDAATLVSDGPATAANLDNAFTDGRRLAGSVLGRTDLSPPAPGAAAPAAGSTAAAQAITAGTAWSAGGPDSYVSLEHLASRDDVGTLVLPDTALPSASSPVVTTPDGGGGTATILLANAGLTSLLGSAGTAPGSAAATSQLFLAQTALLASQHPGSPVIVAPPRRWQPAPGLAASLLAGIASAPWLNPVTLASLAAAPGAAATAAPKVSSPPSFGQPEAALLTTLNAAVTRLQLLHQTPDPALDMAVAATESSGYTLKLRPQALAMIRSLTSQVAAQEGQVRIVAENRVTLGGTHGSVPVSIDNHLGYPVQVAVALSYPAAGGTKIAAAPADLVTVPARTSKTVHLSITTSRVGSTTITMSLRNRAGLALASLPARTTVQTSRVGLLGLIIFAAALGVFLIASAARALRRGRPRVPPGGDDGAGPAAEPLEGAGGPAAAATVVAEHGEFGTAGSPRPRQETR